MISDPNLILYACIAKGPTILAEFSRKEPGIESLAQKCIEKTPPFHSVFSHTASKRSHTFVIDDPFVYFIISHEDLVKSESFWFLNRLKIAFEDFLLTGPIVGTDDLTANCLQSHFNPIFSELMVLDLEFVGSPANNSRNQSMDSDRGKGTMVAPLLGQPIKGLKKKKRSGVWEVNGGESKDCGGGIRIDNMVDVSDDFRDFSVSMQKSGALCSGGERQKAMQTWRKHVWVVLILDLLVCSTLFGI
ncbi:PP2A regulatory subunit TAP46-like [Hibiscus syriacus]|uniref:PP2A regulatory subunit TAP46-like n=1 Tax=Hibiscus syriacus TaxID=106335 RepID=A0A6A3B0K8_HIBSY|nr:phytolongin Phyl2.2-like [Hibiscus syriacus]KAE8708599.1 PP2A regulatory subunit TAP46-like [Hibiscus syriacus]